MNKQTGVIVALVVAAVLGCFCLLSAMIAFVVFARRLPHENTPSFPSPAASPNAASPSPQAAPGPTSPAPPLPSRAPSPGAPVALEWQTHQDPSGFSIDLPKEFKVERDARTGAVRVAGPAGEQALAQPLFVAGAIDARSAPRILRRLAQTIEPAVEWREARGAPGVARIAGTANGRLLIALLAYAPSDAGTACQLFLVGAPDDRFDAVAPALARIVQSFAPRGAPVAAGSRDAVRWVKFDDPKENAFSVDMPEGYTNEGGLFRAAPIDPRVALRTVAPDKSVRVFAGDAEIPPFCEPTRLGESLGFREGADYNPGGVPMKIRRYVRGLDFATDYAKRKAVGFLEQLAFDKEREREDVAEPLRAQQAPLARPGFFFEAHAGDVAFHGVEGTAPRLGYMLAATTHEVIHLTADTEPTGMWHVVLLYGYVASPEKEELARTILDRMIKSFAMNPEWVRMQQNITAESSRIWREANEKISKTISEGYWNRQKVNDELSRRRSNATLGVQDVVDPTSGTEYKVESGSSYYWLDDRGNIVGTNTYSRPGIEYRELVQRP